MPPKRKTKKELATEAAAAAAAAGATETVDEVTGTEALMDNTEPVVLQLLLSNDRMTDIINTANMTDERKVEDPEPYYPMESFMSMTGVQDHASSAMMAAPQGSDICTYQAAHSRICFWCCHHIVDMEYGMPIRYDSVHNSFTLFGCFCSLECVSAHNFSVHMGCDRAWEIHSWIQLLARRYGYSGKVRPAPNKYLLKMFNGPMTIEEFREAHKGLARTFVMNIPPFIHVASQMEMLNTSFLASSKDIRKN
jgi:hypothetical protein